MSAAGRGPVVRAAAIQLRVRERADETIALARDLLRAAAADGVDVAVLPEIFAAPFVGPEPDMEYFAHAEALDGPSNEMAAAVSHETGMTIVSSIFEGTAVEGVFHNTACTFVDGELKQVYRKSHLPFSNGFPEKFYFRPGQLPPSAVADGPLRLGTIICYERHFPELGRIVALDGAHLLCIPVACSSEPTKEVFQLELSAQAAFNRMYVVCANRIGQEGSKCYYGTSAVYGPDGAILAQAADVADEFVAADIDLGIVAEGRRRLPFFRDRRPDLYHGLTRE